MIVVDEPIVAGACGASAAGGVFGDDVVWYPFDTDRCDNPVTDIAIGDHAQPSPEWMAAVVEHCAQGLSLLERVDPTGFDAATTMAWAKGVEQVRRQAAAAGGSGVEQRVGRPDRRRRQD